MKPESDVAKDNTELEARSAAADSSGEDVSELEKLAAELKQANDRVLRAQAELENFRKRARREAAEERRYANLPLLADLLPVLDNLDRAVEVAEQSENATGLLEGVKMVSDQLQVVLDRHHCRRIESLGKPFDPHLHEAIGKEPSQDQEAGIVTRVTQTGYQLHDRVVRPSQVMISSGPAAAVPDSGSSPTDDQAASENRADR